MIAPAGTTHGSPVTMPVQYFHSTPRQEEDSADKAVAKEGEEKGFWDPIYAVPIGIAFAVPALNYEWILVNEETQVGRQSVSKLIRIIMIREIPHSCGIE